MQVLGPVNIGQNIENAQDCEINNFMNSGQNKSVVISQSQDPMSSNRSCQPCGNDVRQIRLNQDIDKIDFIRVINAMCEYGFFTTPSGTKAFKKDVFAAMGEFLGADFSNYQKNLSGSKSVNNDSMATGKIFEDLKSIAEKVVNK